MQHPIVRMLNSAPVNRQAAMAVSQTGCAEKEDLLSKKELVDLVKRLERKQRLLKHVLGIKTKSQHMNAMYKFNRRIGQFRHKDNPRVFIEYKRVGEDIQRLIRELQTLKKIRKFVADQSNNKVFVSI